MWISNNYQKAQAKIAKIHQRIANIRLDNIHKLTDYLVKNHDRVVIENLNVSGMVKNHCLAAAIYDGGFFEFKRQLVYKCEQYGVKLIIAPRFFASTKTCSCCGHKQNMPLKKRIFDCEKCHLKICRDKNAAINLNKLYTWFGVLAPREKPDSYDKLQLSIRYKGYYAPSSGVGCRI